MMKALRIGTRGSELALAQAKLAGEAIAPVFPERPIQIVPIRTRGDRIAGPLQAVGGKGLFTAELEKALRDGQLDLAVHSAKDLPAEMADDLVIAAVLPREDVRDALLSRAGGLDELPVGAKVGTSSLRRSALLRAVRADVEIAHLRGNVDTRIQRVLREKADFDATILAMAGLVRGGWLEKVKGSVHPLPADSFIPAAGQGTLGLQTRANDTELIDALQVINHDETLQVLLAERSVVKRLGASCHSCLAVHVKKRGQVPFFWNQEVKAEEKVKKVPDPFFYARAMVARSDGSDMLRAETQGPTAQAAADTLTEKLIAAGAMERLREG